MSGILTSTSHSISDINFTLHQWHQLHTPSVISNYLSIWIKSFPAVIPYFFFVSEGLIRELSKKLFTNPQSYPLLIHWLLAWRVLLYKFCPEVSIFDIQYNINLIPTYKEVKVWPLISIMNIADSKPITQMNASVKVGCNRQYLLPSYVCNIRLRNKTIYL